MVLKHFPTPVFGLTIGLLLILGQVFFVDDFSRAWVNFSTIYQQEQPLSTQNFSRGVLETQQFFSSLATTYQVAAVSSVADGASWWDQFTAYLADLWQTIVTNWSDFWSGLGGSRLATTTPAVATSTDLTALRADLLKELKAEVTKQVGVAAAQAREGTASQGIVVVPKGGSASEVQNLFSDPVSVQFDQASQSGVITPTYHNRQGSSFIFLLTPIKR